MNRSPSSRSQDVDDDMPDPNIARSSSSSAERQVAILQRKVKDLQLRIAGLPIVNSSASSSILRSASAPLGPSHAATDDVELRDTVTEFIKYLPANIKPKECPAQVSTAMVYASRQQHMEWRRKITSQVSNLMSASISARDTVSDHCTVTYSVAEVASNHMNFIDKSKHQQMQWLVDQLWQPGLVVGVHTTMREGITCTHMKFRVSTPIGDDQEHAVCRGCWRVLHGITKYQMSTAVTMKKAGSKTNAERKTRSNHGINARLSTAAWITGFGKRLGDHMPHVDIVALPVKDKTDLHQVYASAMECCPWDKTLGFSPFLRVLGSLERKHQAQTRKLFLQCTMCHYLQGKISSNIRRAVAGHFKRVKDSHKAHIAVQKAKYYGHRDKGKHFTDKQKYLSVIMDGMDQAKTQLPRMARNPKSLDGCMQIKFHVTGVIVHGLMHCIYTWVDNFPKDPNMTCSVLMETLIDLRALKGPEWEMPSVLYLQLDNASGENKNQAVMTFCCALVYFDVFDRIKISFISVGHTHEDIDQLFSRLSVKWGPQDIWSLDQLVYFAMRVFYGQCTRAQARAAAAAGASEEELAQLIGNYPVTHRHLTVCADIKIWLESLMSKPWRGLTKFRCMKIKRDEIGNVRLRLRRCMCAPDESRCEDRGKNFWEPQHISSQSGDLDGVVVIPFDIGDQMPSASHIPKVPPKPLTAKSEDIDHYFNCVPGAKLRAKRRAAIKKVVPSGLNEGEVNPLYQRQKPESASEAELTDDSEAQSDASQDSGASGEREARYMRSKPMHDGRQYFHQFFKDQAELMDSMCATCRDLRKSESTCRNAKMALEVTVQLNLSMQRFQEAIGKVSPIAADKHDSDEDDIASQDEVDDQDVLSTDDEALPKPVKAKKKETPLTRVRRDVTTAGKALMDHLKDSAFFEEHGRFDTRGIFGKHEVPSEDDMGDFDEVDLTDEVADKEEVDYAEDLPWFICEDQDQCAFQVGGQRDRRRVHADGGCTVGHHVLIKSEVAGAIFFVADVICRNQDNPSTHIDVHVRGNADDRLLGGHFLAWSDKKGVNYFRAKPEHPTHLAWKETVWIEAVITWSSDWHFNKGFTLPARATDRVKHTLDLNWDGKERVNRVPMRVEKKGKPTIKSKQASKTSKPSKAK
jgi:hypothetical protein